MEPISAGLTVVGLGMQLFGGLSAANNAKQQAAISQNIAQQEQGINQQKQMQMQLESRRSLLQNFRNAQRLRAQATASAVNQGAQYGSGLQGGLAGITDNATESALGINQATSIGTNIFNYNNQISSDKEQLASLGGSAAMDQEISNIGGMLSKGAPTISGLAQDAGSNIGTGIFNMVTGGGLKF